MIIGITFIVIVPTTYLFYNYSKESTQEIKDAQLIKIGRDIIDSAESIFYSGKSSKTVVEISLPDNVENAVIIDNRELVFNITTSLGPSEIVFFSPVNLSTILSNCAGNVCTIPALKGYGTKRVKLEVVKVDTVMVDAE